MDNLHVLALADEQEELLRGVDEHLLDQDLPIRFDRVKGVHRALEELQTRSFDAIVCVVERPDELALVVRLRKRASDVPILVLSDALDSQVARWGKALGATEVLERRSSLESFATMLRQVLETRRLTREQRTQLDRTIHLSHDIAALARETNRLFGERQTEVGQRVEVREFPPSPGGG